MAFERASLGSPSASVETPDWSRDLFSAPGTDRHAANTGNSAVLSNIFHGGSDAVKAPPAFAGTEWPAIRPVLEQATSVHLTTPAENAASHVEPDFILGADGMLRQNPNKTEPSAGGQVNIQVEGLAEESIAQAKQLANQLQKQSIRELIDYFQKFNPGAPIPQHWLDMLNYEPDVPRASRGDQGYNPQPQAKQQVSESPAQAPAYRASSGGGRSGSSGGGGGGRSMRGGGSGELSTEQVGPRRHVELPAPIAGDVPIMGEPTITAEKIDEILASYGSPATGLGQYIMDKGRETGINPAVALAFYVSESSCGTEGIAARTKSFGNIKGEGPAGSDKGHRAYHTYEQGIDDWFRLIKEKYVAPASEGGRGCQFVSQIIREYAPASDGNNEQKYVAGVKGMVEGWKTSA